MTIQLPTVVLFLPSRGLYSGAQCESISLELPFIRLRNQLIAMIDLNMRFQKYAPLWNKYRPAILTMMVAASKEPQHYKLTKHEFQALDEKKKTGFGFNLRVAGSRPANSIKNSETAQDLLIMLRLSRKGSQLLNDCTYEIILDNQFMLHISQIESESGTRLLDRSL